jgi:cysteine desulfurase/selenocysteine lyase
MYSLLTDFRSGDNVVTTMMGTTNYVPWLVVSEILPKLGRRVDYRLCGSILTPASLTMHTSRR